MRRATPFLGTALLLLWTAGTLAQGKPNFAGNWVQDKDKTTAANQSTAGNRSGSPPWTKVTIRQDANTFVRETTTDNGQPNPLSYTTDGQPHKMPVGRAEVTYTAKWDGGTMTIEQTQAGANGAPQVTKYTFAMEGDELVITTTQGNAVRKGYYKKG